jgi:hypothetical protein
MQIDIWKHYWCILHAVLGCLWSDNGFKKLNIYPSFFLHNFDSKLRSAKNADLNLDQGSTPGVVISKQLCCLQLKKVLLGRTGDSQYAGYAIFMEIPII